jgi:hypothetical protein
LTPVEVELVPGDVTELGDPLVVGGVDEPHVPRRLQRVEASLDREVVVGDDRVAARCLVARRPQGVQRQRVGVRDRGLLLDQAPEDPHLFVTQRLHRAPDATD